MGGVLGAVDGAVSTGATLDDAGGARSAAHLTGAVDAKTQRASARSDAIEGAADLARLDGALSAIRAVLMASAPTREDVAGAFGIADLHVAPAW